MIISEAAKLLNANVICGEELLGAGITNVFSSDLMSDVLAFASGSEVLVSGLINPQVVRTAEMMDMNCIIFVRGKMPDEAVIALAKEKSIALLVTKCSMFNACGRLYAAGIKGDAALE